MFFPLLLLCLASSAATDIGNVNPKCATCAFLINEVEGFLVENRTETELQTFLSSKCPLFGGTVQFVCAALVKQLPALLVNVESKWDVARLCVDLKMCEMPVTTEGDFQSIPTYQINYDNSPSDRWTSLCGLPHVKTYWKQFISVLQQVMRADLSKAAEDGGLVILELMDPVLAQEIRGCSRAAGTNLGWHALLNVAYELTDACTSIVAESTDGKIFHARNLDFGSGGFLTATMRNVSAIVEIISAGSVFAKETAFIGFVGMLSGQNVPGKFTLTVNTRFYPGSVKKSVFAFLTEIIWAIEQMPNANLAAFLARKAIVSAKSYSDAVEMLSTQELVADIYFTVSGTQRGEGVVITRNRTGAANVWPLHSSATGPV
jgi:hypothetical protein